MKIKIRSRRHPYKKGDKIRFTGSLDGMAEDYLQKGKVYTIESTCYGKFIDEYDGKKKWFPAVWIKGVKSVAFNTYAFKIVK